MDASTSWIPSQTRARFGIGLRTLVLVATCLFGCDAFDPSALMPSAPAPPARNGDASEGAATGLADANEAGATSAASRAPATPRDPEMQSIGPEQSQRIYYQFVDDRGRVQFVERLGDVPAAWRDRVGYVEMSQAPPLTPLDARRTWQLSAGRTAEILLATARPTPAVGGRQNADVVLYSADWCGYCTKAKAHLDRNGIDYEIRDVDDKAIAQELREKTGRGGVPVLDFSGEILRGYSPDQYDRAIRSIQG